MALCQRGLDRTLAFEEPVERSVELVLADVAQGQLDAEARGGGGGIERPGCGELGGRGDDAADDHGQGEVDRSTALGVGLARGLGTDDFVEADRARRAQDGCDMAMRQRTLDDEGLFARRHHDPALEDAAQPLDVLGRPMGEVEQRALSHGLAVPVALAQQDRGRGAAVGDGLDVHGRRIADARRTINNNI